MTAPGVLVALFLLLTCGTVSQAARILGMFPFFPRSHHRVIQPVMATLARAGHEVIVYSPFPMEDAPENYTHVYLNNTMIEGGERDKFIVEITSLPYWKCLDAMWYVYDLEYKDFVNDKAVQKLISSGEKFDLIVLEPTCGTQEYTLIMHHIFKAPVIGIQAFFTNSLVNVQAGNTLAIPYMPDTCTAFSNKMTFVERMFNALSILRGVYFHYNKHIPRLEGIMREKFPDMPPLKDLMGKVSLMFVNDHPTADYSAPKTPNIIPVAGIHINPEKPLPQDIQKFVDGAQDGFIVFSLGTYVPDDLKPQEYFDMYNNVFKKLRQRVLWKTRKQNIKGLPSNVMAVKWLPQQDVLAHPKCVLFITHGGLLSQHEAVYNGVPVIGIPQFFDQRRNVRFYEEHGIGVKLEVDALSEATVSAAIQKVLGDPKYRENMQRMSRIFRDRPMSPAETVVFWSEYVMRHGGAPHLRPASTLLPWYQLILLDVIVVVLATVVCLVAALYVIVRKVLSVICGKTKFVASSTKKTN